MLIFSIRLIRVFIDNQGYNKDLEEISFDRSSPLGALGRRFESCRPDSNNPSHKQVSQPVFFIGCKMTYSYLCHIYVICLPLLSYSQIYLVIPNKFLKDSYLRNTLIKVRGVVFRELGVQP